MDPVAKPQVQSTPQAVVEKPTTTTPSAEPQHTHPGVYIGAIATGVFAAAATTTGVLALSKQKDFDAANKDGNFAKANSLADKGKTYALLTDIGIGAALVSAGVATYFYFAPSSKSAEQKAANSAWQIAPSVDPLHAGVTLLGKF